VGQNNAVIILDATTLEELIVLKTPLTPISLAFSADGSALIGCSDKGVIMVWSGSTSSKPE